MNRQRYKNTESSILPEIIQIFELQVYIVHFLWILHVYVYICIYSPSNGFTDPILTKRLPSLHPAALISDQYPALCRLPYSLYSLSNDFDTLVPAGNQKGEKWCQIPSYIHVLCFVCTKVIFYIQCIKHVYILHAKKYNVTYYV